MAKAHTSADTAPHTATSPVPVVIERELSLRAVLTGVLLGVLLTPSNVYAGLKIGWSFNMSIIALLLGVGFWQGVAARATRGAPWSLHESNINQTVASAAASIISGGLVAPIPAYTLLTGDALAAGPMMAWVFSVSFLGIWIAWYLRPALLDDHNLSFPEGMATLETLTHVYSHGREAMLRLQVLFATAAAAALVKWADIFYRAFPRWSPTPLMERLSFTFDPSLLLLGFGAIVGLRVGLSLLLGAVLAWGGIAPWLLASGQVALPASATGPQFSVLVQWLLWPGVSLMVCATLAALAARLWQQSAVVKPGKRGGAVKLPQRGPAIGLALALAAVAARVVGATGIPPIGAIGQLSQLCFGIIAPGQVPVNLMSANTAGGAAGQCTDLMNDFKVGLAIGATPWKQVIAQCLGIAVGSVTGVLVYQALIPDPQTMLLTEQWPAPAVATWKAVAQTLSLGLGSLSPAIRWAIVLAGITGLALGLLDTLLPAQKACYLPNAAAFGLAFVLPASVCGMMALGAVLAFLAALQWPRLSRQYALAAAAGLIAGESMTGVGASFWQMFKGA